MKSIWMSNINMKQFPTLSGNKKTDVLIIGGGMAGVLCAWHLEQAGVDYLLVEGERIGSGITKNTTAKVTSQHGLFYDKLLRKAGKEAAGKYLDVNQLAVAKFKELSGQIDCDFEQKRAMVYSRTDRVAIEREAAALDKLNFRAWSTDRIPLPFDIAGAIGFADQGQFHPLKFLTNIAKDLKIYEHTYVRELAKKLGKIRAVTKYGDIEADQVIVATHFPFLNKHGSYFLKQYQHRSYAIALKDGPAVGGMYLEERMDGMSFRNYKDFLIIGGGDHRTGKNGGNWRVLKEFAAKHYPQAKIVRAWATQDCMTLDGIPYIGQYSASTSGLYVATGFNKWGMTSSMVSAMILTDLIMGKRNDYASVFDPSRSIVKPQLMINGFEAITGLLTPSIRRCPHMGCALKWNKHEHTWDCSCHGSRFDKQGKLIDNPATGGLNE